MQNAISAGRRAFSLTFSITQREAIDQRGSRPGSWEVFSQTAIGTTSLGSRPASRPRRGPTRPVLAGLERLVKAVSFLVSFIYVHRRSSACTAGR